MTFTGNMILGMPPGPRLFKMWGMYVCPEYNAVLLVVQVKLSNIYLFSIMPVPSPSTDLHMPSLPPSDPPLKSHFPFLVILAFHQTYRDSYSRGTGRVYVCIWLAIHFT